MKKIKFVSFLIFCFNFLLPITPVSAITALECQQQGIPDEICQSMIVDGLGSSTDANISQTAYYQTRFTGYNQCVQVESNPTGCLAAFPDGGRAPGNPSFGTPTTPAGNSGAGNSATPSVRDVSGRVDSNTSTNQSKCDKPGDEFCPAPKFCYINGLCVPAPEAEAREGSLRGAGSIFEVIAIVLKWLLTLAGVIATVFLIFGGYQYITAGGNEEQSEKGKQTLINAVIGIVIVLLSMTIITIVTNTLSSTGPLG